MYVDVWGISPILRLDEYKSEGEESDIMPYNDPDGQYDVAVQSADQMETVDHCTTPSSIQMTNLKRSTVPGLSVVIPKLKTNQLKWSFTGAFEVLKESFKVYCVVNDGKINLPDKFFEMSRHEAVKDLEIYKRAVQQVGSLSDFSEICKGLELARNFQFLVLREPPQSFLATMEEYVREAPSVVIVPSQPLVCAVVERNKNFQRLMLTYHPEESVPDEDNKSSCEEPHPEASENIEASDIDGVSPSPTPANNPDTGDLLGLNNTSPDASAIEDSNALALAILPTDGASTSSSGAAALNSFDPTGWELALVTTQARTAPVERKLAGGLDLLTLGSLYDEVSNRANQQQSMYESLAPNPFELHNPFTVSNNINERHVSATKTTHSVLTSNSFGNAGLI